MSQKSSQKRIEANRRNAQQSTGPSTAEGKSKSASNSTIHGFSSLNMNPFAPVASSTPKTKTNSVAYLVNM